MHKWYLIQKPHLESFLSFENTGHDKKLIPHKIQCNERLSDYIVNNHELMKNLMKLPFVMIVNSILFTLFQDDVWAES